MGVGRGRLRRWRGRGFAGGRIFKFGGFGEFEGLEHLVLYHGCMP